MNISEHIFREYDIRGTVDKELSPAFAYILGRAYGQLVRESGLDNIAVGQDCRLSSPAYAQALAQGIADEGRRVLLTGMGPTPQLYYSIFSKDLGGGIQVTGSHNPADMNGFKLCVEKRTLSGEAIQDILRRVLAFGTMTPAPTAQGRIEKLEIQQEYINYLVDNVKPHMGGRKLKVVVDGGNGVGGMVGPEVLRRIGCEVIELFCEPDGRFPNHHPDPTVVANLKSLIATVKETKADVGIGWDGDADRIGAVDETGQIIFGDMLLLIYGREILKTVPGAAIIGDVKCSSRLFEDLAKRGGMPIMWKTGHSLIKGKLKETHAELAGEMSGHIFFANRYFGFDDALYSSCRLVEILSNTKQRTSELLADLPPVVSTPELRVDCPEEVKFKVAKEAPSLFKEFKVDTTDGARITFEHGWALVRASNTQPVLVMRFEADTEARLEEYRTLVINRIDAVRKRLS